MSGSEIRQKFLEFFKQKGHTIIPSASLIPENDPSVLFTTAGMHPLVPYLMGNPHPSGKRLADSQKCLRTTDIESVGDATHLTFFEMLGNWSLGDYFKDEAIEWSYEFLTSKDWLEIAPSKIAISVFSGDKDAPRDDVSKNKWLALGVSEERIAYLGKENNWWPAGGKHPGPQGPDTEMFVWTGDGAAPEKFDPEEPLWVEVWNDVFMEFNRTPDGKYAPLAQKNVDTGMGLERIAAVMQGVKSPYDTDLFVPIMQKIQELAGAIESEEQKRVQRIIADHLRAATFVLGDSFGVEPSNLDQGYILRRLIRRAVRYGSKTLGIAAIGWTRNIASVVVEQFGDAYPELRQNQERIYTELQREEERFADALKRGLAHLKKQTATLSTDDPETIGSLAFYVYETHGFPFEMTMEELQREFGMTIDVARIKPHFDARFERHQDLSRAGAEKKFAGGLADHSPRVIRQHTATHLLHRALKNILGEEVEQKGSNITQERLRFDFNFPRKLTSEEIKAVEDMVNTEVEKDVPVHWEELTTEEAKKRGAIGYFDDKYAQLGNKLKVYFVGDDTQGYFSKEICGGPHVEHTGVVGKFKILKEEACSAGIRRIKATVEDY